MIWDTKVYAEDARPAGRKGECFYCRQPLGQDHKTDCVIVRIRQNESFAPYVWHPIETMVDGEHVALWFPVGERGNGGIEMAMVYRDSLADGEWSYWTHGGPNSGSDWYPRNNERPTMWMRLLDPEKKS